MAKTHSFIIFSICARSWGVARLMKGKSARFRARRMRLLMTMSASGPLPWSHSPLLRARSFSSTAAIPASGPLHDVSFSMRRISSRSSEARSYFSPSIASFISRRRRINWVRRSLSAGLRRGRFPTCSPSP